MYHEFFLANYISFITLGGFVRVLHSLRKSRLQGLFFLPSDLREGIFLRDPGSLHMIDNGSILQVFPLDLQFSVFVTTPDILLRIIQRYFLKKYIPHLIVGAFIEDLMYHFLFFHTHFPLSPVHPAVFSNTVLPHGQKWTTP